MGKPFAKKFLQDQEEIFKDGTVKFLNRIETIRKASNDQVDIYGELGNYAFDVLSEIPLNTIALIDSRNCLRRPFQKGGHSTRRQLHSIGGASLARTGIITSR